MVLFPSYLMHAVPPNQGERRITLSFNAIPDPARFVGLRRQAELTDGGAAGAGARRAALR